jgi:hypothetical protein
VALVVLAVEAQPAESQLQSLVVLEALDLHLRPQLLELLARQTMVAVLVAAVAIMQPVLLVALAVLVHSLVVAVAVAVRQTMDLHPVLAVLAVLVWSSLSATKTTL